LEDLPASRAGEHGPKADSGCGASSLSATLSEAVCRIDDNTLFRKTDSGEVGAFSDMFSGFVLCQYHGEERLLAT
jgi:hypothetical protein